jgi:hypothetical protein
VSSRTSSREATQEGRLVHEVREGPLTVDLDYRQPLAVLRLQPWVTGDVDLLELERNRLGDGDQRLARALAEMAARRVVEDDARYG